MTRVPIYILWQYGEVNSKIWASWATGLPTFDLVTISKLHITQISCNESKGGVILLVNHDMLSRACRLSNHPVYILHGNEAKVLVDILELNVSYGDFKAVKDTLDSENLISK